jgi:hypothetical protein
VDLAKAGPFEPTSAGLLVPVCLLALAGFAVTLWLWRRMAGRGPLAVLSRTGLLLTCQVLITASLVLLSNKYFVFYQTWNDLFGSDRVNVGVKNVQNNKGQESNPADLIKKTATDLAPRRKNRKPDRAKDGQVDKLEIRGARSGLDTEAYAYLPPQYFQPQYAKKRLPVTMFMSGGSSDDKLAWIKQAKLAETGLQEAAAGRAQPMIFIMLRSYAGLTPAKQPPAGPEATKGLPKTAPVGGGHPTTCLDVPGLRGAQAETFYAQDLPVSLADTYRLPRTRKGWAAVGYGTSGQCAARLAMFHSDRFAAAAVVDGNFDLPEGGVGQTPKGKHADLYGGSKAFRQDNDLLWRMQNLPQPPVAMMLAAGSGSGKAAQQATQFAGLARPPMKADKSLVTGAPATLKAWRTDMPALVDWLGAHLQGE